MSTQVVRPAGAGHETLYVCLLALAILLCAGLVVMWQAQPQTQQSAVDTSRLDARRDLRAAEQGIHTDLLVALDEIRLYLEDEQRLPTPAQLAEEGFPPFIADASAVNRGGHTWQLLRSDSTAAYFGRSNAEDTAGSFLLLLDGEEASVWLNRSALNDAPIDLHELALNAAGWRQVFSEFDAGVTRQHRH